MTSSLEGKAVEIASNLRFATLTYVQGNRCPIARAPLIELRLPGGRHGDDDDPASLRVPPNSGNGGYVCGMLAHHITGAAEVTPRAPARTTGIEVENPRRMRITVQRMRTWLARAGPHIAGPIHFSAQLFQHINGLSPTSQFSPSGGAGGNAPPRGAKMPTRPSR